MMNAWVSMSGFTYIKLICGAPMSDKNICGVCFEFHAPQIGKRSNVGMWHEFYRCVQEDRKVKNDNMVFVGALFKRPWRCRSEEHTSELQSRPHLVCRLLLEKKNKNINTCR